MAGPSTRHAVGLDIGTTGVRAVEVRRRRGHGELEVMRAAAVELPRGTIRNGIVLEPRALTKALRTLWRRGHFSTRRMAFALPDSGILTRQLDVPWMPPEDFRLALRYQVQDALPVDLATVELDYHLLDGLQRTDNAGHVIDENRILVVAANRDATLTEANAIRKANLEPVQADSSAFALIRAACRGALPTSQEAHVLVDIGADSTTVVVHGGGQPRFIRTIANLGGDTATAAVAAGLDLDLDAAEARKRATGLKGPTPVVATVSESSVFSAMAGTAPALDPASRAAIDALNPWATTVVAEIRNSIDYFRGLDPDTTISDITLSGRSAQLPGLVERVATQLPYAVHAVDAFSGVAVAARLQRRLAQDADYSVALGLALAVA